MDRLHNSGLRTDSVNELITSYKLRATGDESRNYYFGTYAQRMRSYAKNSEAIKLGNAGNYLVLRLLCWLNRIKMRIQQLSTLNSQLSTLNSPRNPLRMMAALLFAFLLPFGLRAAHYPIDLSDATGLELSGLGYFRSGGTLTFYDDDATHGDANLHTYTITQSGGSLISGIVFQSGVTTTVTIDGINYGGSMTLQGTANLTLLLSGANTISGTGANGRIVVGGDASTAGATLTIDTAVAGSSLTLQTGMVNDHATFPGYINILDGNIFCPNIHVLSGGIDISGGTIKGYSGGRCTIYGQNFADVTISNADVFGSNLYVARGALTVDGSAVIDATGNNLYANGQDGGVNIAGGSVTAAHVYGDGEDGFVNITGGTIVLTGLIRAGGVNGSVLIEGGDVTVGTGQPIQANNTNGSIAISNTTLTTSTTTDITASGVGGTVLIDNLTQPISMRSMHAGGAITIINTDITASGYIYATGNVINSVPTAATINISGAGHVDIMGLFTGSPSANRNHSLFIDGQGGTITINGTNVTTAGHIGIIGSVVPGAIVITDAEVTSGNYIYVNGQNGIVSITDSDVTAVNIYAEGLDGLVDISNCTIDATHVYADGQNAVVNISGSTIVLTGLIRAGGINGSVVIDGGDVTVGTGQPIQANNTNGSISISNVALTTSTTTDITASGVGGTVFIDALTQLVNMRNMHAGLSITINDSEINANQIRATGNTVSGVQTPSTINISGNGPVTVRENLYVDGLGGAITIDGTQVTITVDLAITGTTLPGAIHINQADVKVRQIYTSGNNNAINITNSEVITTGYIQLAGTGGVLSITDNSEVTVATYINVQNNGNITITDSEVATAQYIQVATGTALINGNSFVTAMQGLRAGTGGDINIGSAATVIAYRDASPAITRTTNTGWYVDAFLNTGMTTIYPLLVYADGNVSTTLATINLPLNYRYFAFHLPGMASTNQYNVYEQRTTGLTPVVRNFDGDFVIYPVNSSTGYSAHGGVGGALPLKTTLPNAGVSSVSNIAQTAATFTSTYHTLNGATFTQGGFYYSTSPAVDIDGKLLSVTQVLWAAQNATSPKSETVSGLTPNTHYYMQNYLVTSAGTVYSDVISFATLPMISTASVTAGAPDEVLVSAIFTGGNDPLTVTIYYDTDWINSGSPSSWSAHQSVTLGSSDFNHTGFNNFSITGLLPDTPYYILTVLENATGKDAYELPYDMLPVIFASVSASNIGKYSATFTSPGHYVFGATFTQGGFYYGTSATTDPDGKLQSATQVLWKTQNTANPKSENVINLIPNTRYYMQACIATSKGTFYNEVMDFVTLPGFVDDSGSVTAGGSPGQALISAAFEGGQEALTVKIYYDTVPINSNAPLSWTAHSSVTLTGSDFDHTGFTNYLLAGLTPDTPYFILIAIENETGINTYYLGQFANGYVFPIYTIDLSIPLSVPGATYNGSNTFTFNTDANLYQYKIIQSMGNSAPSLFVTGIVFPTDVYTTATIDNINYNGNMTLQGRANLTLLLSGANTIGGNIVAGNGAGSISGTTLTIDEAASGSSLTVTGVIYNDNGTYEAFINIKGGEILTTRINTNSGGMDISGGTIRHTGAGTVSIYTQNFANLTIRGNTKIYNGGNIYVSRGVLTVRGNVMIEMPANHLYAQAQDGIVNVFGGTITAANIYAGGQDGQVNITGGTISATNIYADSQDATVNISSGAINVTAAIRTGGVRGSLSISGGSITATNVYTSGQDGFLGIGGGSITATNIYADGQDATANISGGTIDLTGLIRAGGIRGKLFINGNSIIRADGDIYASNTDGTLSIFGSVDITCRNIYISSANSNLVFDDPAVKITASGNIYANSANSTVKINAGIFSFGTTTDITASGAGGTVIIDIASQSLNVRNIHAGGAISITDTDITASGYIYATGNVINSVPTAATINISGAGHVDIMGVFTGSPSANRNHSLYVDGQGGTITINGTKVTTEGHIGIIGSVVPGAVVITGAEVMSGNYIYANDIVNITDSDITATNIYTSGQGGLVNITDSDVAATTIYTSGQGGLVNITDSDVAATTIYAQNDGNITITDSEIATSQYIQVATGTMLINGASDVTAWLGLRAGTDGNIVITGASTVYAVNNVNNATTGAAIGGSGNVTIDSGTNILAYAQYASAIRSATDNSGNGWYVNAYLQSISPYPLEVYDNGTTTPLLTTLNLPENYRYFAFHLPGMTAPGDNYNIYEQRGTGPEPVVRNSDANPIIYSVNTLAGYSTHGGVNGALPLRGAKPNAGIVTVSNINNTSATFTSTGHVVNGATFTQGGFYHSTVPTIDATGKLVSGTQVLWTTQNATSPKTQVVSGLTPNTKYYIQSYLATSAGTFYSDVISFVTLPMVSAVSAIAGGTTDEALISATFTGGNEPLTVKIYYADILQGESTTVTLTNSDFTSAGFTNFSITGLTPGAGYYFTVVLENEQGIAAGSLLYNTSAYQIIDLSFPASVTGCAYNGTNTMTFSTVANSNQYLIVQSDSTAMITSIVIPTSVNTTVVLNGTNSAACATSLQGTADVNLLLAGVNTMGTINIPLGSSLTINSAGDPGSTAGTLNIPTSAIVVSGTVTIDGGTLNIPSYYGNGLGYQSSIGPPQRSRPGTAYIIINNGELNLGNLGDEAFSDGSFILITGGVVNVTRHIAKGDNGPGGWTVITGGIIRASTILHVLDSRIAITGGDITLTPDVSTFAMAYPAQIGMRSTWGGKAPIDIGSEVNLKVISNANPAIDPLADNAEDGYYVQARLNAALPVGSVLKIYDDNDRSTVLMTLDQSNYLSFAFQMQGSTDSTAYYIEVYNSSGNRTGILVRVADNSTIIYSTNILAGYNAYNSNANNMVLPVRLATVTPGTPTVNNISFFTAAFHSNGQSVSPPAFTYNGGGFYFSQSNSKDANGMLNASDVMNVPWDDFSTDEITKHISGLLEGTQYYMQTYIETTGGNFYSVTVPFLTLTRYNYTSVFDLSESVNTDSNPPDGYTITGVTAGNKYSAQYPPLGTQGNATNTNAGKLIFNTNANGKVFKIVQSGVRNPFGSPARPKAGTAIFDEIRIETGVNVTLVIDDIDLIGNINVQGDGDLTLLLDNTGYYATCDTSYVNGHIIVSTVGTDTAKIVIDDANNPGTGATDGGLKVVTTDQYTAGIGGGSSQAGGNITIDGGVVNVSGGSIAAAIGGGFGGAGGNIEINGGMVTAICADPGNGAGIGGGSSGAGGNIMITDGTVIATSFIAAGIGSGNGGSGGNIVITGGTVTATSLSGAGIGGGRQGTSATIEIGKDANIKAYSLYSMLSEHRPAIDANGPNQGNGYYVNAQLNESLSDTEIDIYVFHDGYSGSNPTDRINTLTMPAYINTGYRAFAYTTGASPRTDNLYADLGYNATLGFNDIRLIDRVADSLKQIYSINDLDQYDLYNSAAGDGVLPVKLRDVPVAGVPSVINIEKEKADLVSTGHSLGGHTYVGGGFRYSSTLSGGKPDTPTDLPWSSSFVTTPITENTGAHSLMPNTKYYVLTYLEANTDAWLVNPLTSFTIESATVAEFVTLPGISHAEVNDGLTLGDALISATFDGGAETLTVTIYWDTNTINPNNPASWSAHNAATLTFSTDYDFTGFLADYELNGLAIGNYNILIVSENVTGYDYRELQYKVNPYKPNLSGIFEIWNWDDLAHVMYVQSEYPAATFALMQHIGTPGGTFDGATDPNYGNGADLQHSDPDIIAAHSGDKRFGWYGYRGFTGLNRNTPYASYLTLFPNADIDAITDYADGNSLQWTVPFNANVGWEATEGWIPIGNFIADNPFAGKFDGQGFAVSGLRIDRPASIAQGLFGYVQGISTLLPAKIEYLGVNISDDGVTGNEYVGGLIGFANRLEITNCYVTGKIRGTNYVGGLVGSIGGPVTPIINCYATGEVEGRDYIGGLAGYLMDIHIVSECYATGDVTGTGNRVGGLAGILDGSGPITNCYTTGTVEGKDYVGGLLGYTYTPITNSFAFNPSVTGNSDVGRVAGMDGNSNSLTNNYALKTMEVTIAGIPTPVTGAHDDKNGENISNCKAIEEASYDATWDFTGTPPVWTFNYADDNINIATNTNLPALYVFNETDFPFSEQNPQVKECTTIKLNLKVFLEGVIKPGPVMTNYIQAPDGYINSVFSTSKLPLTDPYGLGVTCPDIQDTLGAAGKVVDWIQVMVAENFSIGPISYTIDTLEIQEILLKPDGSIVDVDGNPPQFTPQANPVTIIVQHRSHLAAVSLPVADFSTDVFYDFSTAGQALSAGPPPMVLKEGVYCMWAGDVDGNEFIEAGDIALIRKDMITLLFDQYINTDLNMDGITDNVDTATMEAHSTSVLYSPMVFFVF